MVWISIENGSGEVTDKTLLTLIVDTLNWIPASTGTQPNRKKKKKKKTTKQTKKTNKKQTKQNRECAYVEIKSMTFRYYNTGCVRKKLHSLVLNIKNNWRFYCPSNFMVLNSLAGGGVKLVNLYQKVS